MKLIIGIILSLLSVFLENTIVEDCAIENFVGTWEGKVFYAGDEMPQVFSLSTSEDGKSLIMDDKTDTKHELKVENCIATLIVKEGETNMESIYTFANDSLTILSKVEFPDPDGNPYKAEMTGFMTKVE